jgi:Protein of unknown function (DUF2800)
VSGLHSVLGGSQAHRYLQCPGSVKQILAMERTGETSRAGFDAARGTALHALTEICILHDDEPRQWLGKMWKTDDGFDVMIGDDEVAALQQSVDLIRELMDDEYEVELEKKVVPPVVTPTPDLAPHGTADVRAYLPITAHLVVVDHKFGAGHVEVVNNPQLRFYACAAMHSLEAEGHMVETVTIIINQPALGPPRSENLAAGELRAWVAEVLQPGIDACFEDNPPLVAGDWCRFCPVRNACPALREMVLASARAEFDAPVKPSTLSDDELVEVLDRGALIEAWLDGVREEAEQRLKNGASLTGWAMLPKRATRQWVSAPEVISALHKNKFTSDLYMESVLLSPAKLEKKSKQAYALVASLAPAISSGDKLTQVPKETDSHVQRIHPEQHHRVRQH